MKVDFFNSSCKDVSSATSFYIYDDNNDEKTPAYIKENREGNYIAELNNNSGDEITFVAIDHCIPLKRESGEDAQRCDGLLSFNKTIIFVELKDRKDKQARKWKNEGVQQLKETIHFFEQQDEAKQFETKRAYIANKKHQREFEGNNERTQRFLDETGYILKIQNRIEI